MIDRRAALVLAVVACKGSDVLAPVGARVGPSLSAALAAVETVRTPWRCASADLPAVATETLTIHEHSWKLADHAMVLDAKGPVTIGVVADAGGAAPATVAVLGRIRTQLATADLVITLGGMGATQPELEATLGALADRAPWPIVALAGDLEPASAQLAAIAALRARGHVVVDGRLVRRIEVPGASIATIPGAGTIARLVARGDGCGYSPQDVTEIFAELTARPGLRIIASAEAPRVTVDGDPAGDLALTPSAQQQIDLALYAPAGNPESPARTGGRDGAAIALTPGTCDATTRLPGPRHAPSAGLLTITGNTWRWKPVVDVD